VYHPVAVGWVLREDLVGECERYLGARRAVEDYWLRREGYGDPKLSPYPRPWEDYRQRLG
jgi:hypothetical protein